MAAILEAQLECYEHSVDQVRAEPRAVRAQLEEAILVGAALYEAVKAEARAMDTAPLTPEQELRAEETLHGRFERLGRQLDALNELVTALRQHGQPVRGSEQLEQIRDDLRLVLRFTPQQMRAAREAIESGKGVPLARMRDELRRRLLAAS
jgi:hypothetical protein